MKPISRRSLLKYAAGSALGCMMQPILSPKLLLAQTPGGGTGKNVVFVNLLGGLDGLTAFPFLAGANVEVVNSELRPELLVSPASVLPIHAQTGISNKIGMHSAFQPLVSVAGANMKIIQNYGIKGESDRSHDTSQNLMSLGVNQLEGGEMVGFLAKIMDISDWDTFQYWALSNTNAPDTNSTKNPPVTIRELDSFDFNGVGWEGEREREFSLQLQRSLLELPVPNPSLGDSYHDKLELMHSAVGVVRDDIAPQVVGNNAAGDYGGSRLGSKFRDAARILKAKSLNPNFGYRDKDTMILIAQSGYDTHSDQENSGNVENSLSGRLGALSSELAVLYQDLVDFGMIDNTVFVLYSEFGRTNFQNGGGNGSSEGTDHGHGSSTVVFGGPVESGVIGAPPSAADLRDEEYNALRPQIDYRDVFSDVVSWLGIDPKQVFDDPRYTRLPLGIIS